ncbi:hypothetical protein D3C85_1557080 [compost metagenome]
MFQVRRRAQGHRPPRERNAPMPVVNERGYGRSRSFPVVDDHRIRLQLVHQTVDKHYRSSAINGIGQMRDVVAPACRGGHNEAIHLLCQQDGDGIALQLKLLVGAQNDGVIAGRFRRFRDAFEHA